MNMRQGHGYGAEYGNKTVDRILGKKVEGGQEKENGHHKKSGADKIVNGQKFRQSIIKVQQIRIEQDLKIALTIIQDR